MVITFTTHCENKIVSVCVYIIHIQSTCSCMYIHKCTCTLLRRLSFSNIHLYMHMCLFTFIYICIYNVLNCVHIISLLSVSALHNL